MLIAIIAGRIGNNAELKTTKNETKHMEFNKKYLKHCLQV